MFIQTNPKGQVYMNLIDLAFQVCDEFILVVRNDLGKNNSLYRVLEKLKPSLKEVNEQYEWPGTIHCSSPAMVYYYNADNHAKEILKQSANSLYDWVQPNLPEDLSFVKDCKPWLISTSHEHVSSILTNEDDEK